MKVCPKCSKQHDKNGVYCSRSCANSRTWTEEDKRKKSDSSKKYYSENVSHLKGKPGWTHSDEMKELKRKRAEEQWDRKGRRSQKEKRAIRLAAVHRYRARLIDATPDDADEELIKLIFKYRPEGYDVDHIIPLSKGGLHHQDNLQYLPLRENRYVKNSRDKYDKSLVVRWQDVLQEEF